MGQLIRFRRKQVTMENEPRYYDGVLPDILQGSNYNICFFIFKEWTSVKSKKAKMIFIQYPCFLKDLYSHFRT